MQRIFDRVRIEQDPDGSWVIEPNHIGWIVDSRREALRMAISEIPGPETALGSDPVFILSYNDGTAETYDYSKVKASVVDDRGVLTNTLDPDFDFS